MIQIYYCLIAVNFHFYTILYFLLHIRHKIFVVFDNILHNYNSGFGENNKIIFIELLIHFIFNFLLLNSSMWWSILLERIE